MSPIMKAAVVLLAAVLCYILYCVMFGLFSREAESMTLTPVIYTVFAFAASFILANFLRLRSRFFILSLGVLTFLAALILALKSNTEPVSDFGYLYSFAEAIKNGDVKLLWENDYFLRWAYQSLFVIYEAAVISIFPWGISTLLTLNAVFMAGIVFLIYLISSKIFKEEVARFIALAYFFYPAPYFLATVLTNQHISLFFLLLGIYVIICNVRIANGIIGGVLLALGNALRPDGTLIIAAFLLLVIVILFFSKKKIRSSAKEVLPIIIAIGCSLVAGMLISGIVMISGINPNGQKNMDPLWKLVIGLNAETMGGYSDELDYEVFAITDVNERHELEKEIIRGHLSDGTVLINLLFEKTKAFWGDNEDISWTFNQGTTRIVPLINKPLNELFTPIQQAERLYFAVFVTLGILSLVLLFFSKAEINATLILCGLVVVLFFIIYMFIEQQPRYRYFSYPFLLLLTGGAISRFASFYKFTITSED